MATPPSHLTEQRASMIANLRSGVINNARKGGRSKHPKTYLDGHEDFHAIRKHLSDEFLKELAGSSRTVWAEDGVSVLNSLERKFFDELDRLESEWGLDRKQRPYEDRAKPASLPLVASNPPPSGGNEDLGYSYPKAVLKAEIPKANGTLTALSGQKPHALSVVLCVKNDHHSLLLDCSAILLRLAEGDVWVEVNEMVRAGKKGVFPVQARKTYNVSFLTRDISDGITPGPFMLHLLGRELPLKEDTTYTAILELRSPYKWPTLVTLKIETGQRLQAHISIIDMKLPDAAYE